MSGSSRGIGSGGPSERDRADHELMMREPELQKEYFDGYGRYRFAVAHEVWTKVLALVQVVRNHAKRLKVLEEGVELLMKERKWTRVPGGGGLRGGGLSRGKRKKTGTSSSSSSRTGSSDT